MDNLNDSPQADDSNPAEDLTDALAGAESTEFVTDEKKPVNRTTLVLFLLMALGGGGLYFMHLRTGPKSAAAALNADTAQASATIDQFLQGGDQNLKAMEQMLRNTEKVVQQFLKYPSAAQIPLTELQTNPFKLVSNQPKTTASSNNTADRKKREEERLSVLKAVQTLQLQSVVHSDARKACMINNSMYKEGQQISGFTVEKISPDSVIVKNGAYRFELKMQK